MHQGTSRPAITDIDSRPTLSATRSSSTIGSGGSKQALAGIVFDLGMALGAANFITWMF